ncbi:tetraacyldisaccharide 4'-kinase [Armatimonadetes bacterium Uphvl-Ar1]|nr:tetraacyldisaccharide 4'-kinase [Armatimonadetes bacterium Uphvl-Ar1]
MSATITPISVKAAIERAWEEKGHLAYILSPLSLLYQLGWRTYLAIYEFGLKKPHIPTIPTIVVGNFTAGGSGKTPFTLYLAQALTERSHPIVLSTSGYGSPKYHGATLAPKGSLDVEEWGDESTMFRELLPDLPLIVGHDRVAAAQLAAQQFPDHILLMDDGFQHLRLKPDLSLIIEPDLENDFCFPAGPYREPKSVGARRATRVLTYDEHIQPLPLLLNPPLPSNTKVNALCAIGQPHRFLNSLQTIGLQVQKAALRPDHDPLTAGNLFANLDPELPLVVTAKDYVKLKNHPESQYYQISIANYLVAPKHPEEFLNWLESQIHELRKEKTPR